MTELNEEQVKQGVDVGLLKKIIILAKPHWKYIIRLIPIMMLAAGVDVFFVYFNKYIIDNIIIPNAIEKVPTMAIIFALVAVLQALNILIFIRLGAKIETYMAYDLRKIGFKKLQELSLSYYDKNKVGKIMARMTSDVSRLSEMLSWGLVDFSWGFSMMTLFVIVMLIQNWKLALITLSVLPVLLVFAVYLQKKILKAYRKVRKINSEITGNYNEGISGAKTTKTLLIEKNNIEAFKKTTTNMRQSSIRAAIYSALMWPIVMFLGNTGMALALSAGGRMVALGTISLGTLAMFINFAGQFFMPVQDMARIMAEYQRAQAAGERILALIETESQITDTAEVEAIYGDSFNPKKKNWEKLKGNITFEHVSFQYIKGERVLDDFNIDIKQGESIALVGETGSGKSTIVNLACRFYEPTDGIIYIDGRDYKERTQLWLHSNLGYVLQSPHLFSGTIAENIAYGKDNTTMEEIIEAAKVVHAHSFIMKMEKGYESEVGEGGGNLSTGQKQLISFARAILADPKILVLDEATSSVDTETEHVIQKAVEKVLQGRTSFIIAHRLSTIRHADRILVIEKGKVVEEGSHHELMNQKGHYYQLYTNQFMEECDRVAIG